MSKLKMNCGYCGRKCDLDKDFCIPQDSVYVCKSCYEWQNRVADLEAKLAESKEQCENLWKWSFQELQETQQQLAEKEKQIDTQKDNIQFLYDLFVTPKGEQTLKAISQDKISFAVEQLEKVKELLYPELRFDYSLYLRVMHELDNQISELKEGK